MHIYVTLTDKMSQIHVSSWQSTRICSNSPNSRIFRILQWPQKSYSLIYNLL